jgi:hypothetical protein
MVAGEDEQHAVRRLRRGDIDGADARVRVRRAQEIAARRADEPNVVDIAAAAAQQIGVFLSRDWLPDTELAHGERLPRLSL